MEKTELKLGQYVIGKNNITYQEGTIDKIEQSTGSRKGLIYKVGINWFFADEIEIDQEGILFAFLQWKGVCEFGKDHGCKFVRNGEKYTLQGLCHSEHFVYLVVTTSDGYVKFICARMLNRKTLNKVFNFVNAIFSGTDLWESINIK